MTGKGKFLNSRTLVFLLFLLLLTAFAFKAAPRSATSDFRRYHTAGRAVLDGTDIYAAEGRLQFKYLPCFAQCMAPFALLDISTSIYLWYAVIALGFTGMLLITLRLALPEKEKRKKLSIAVAVLALLITGRFFVDNARLGQINIPVALLAFAGLYCVIKGHERKGGILTAWAACLKFMPIMLIAYYAWQRRWRAVLYGLAGIFLFCFMIPTLTWGWSENWSMLKGYADRRGKMVQSVPQEDAPGQSVPATLNRLLRPVRASSLHESDDRSYSINFADLPVKTVNMISLAAVILLTIIVAWQTRPQSKEKRNSQHESIGAGLVLILMLLISPEARQAHFITLILPAGLLAAYVLDNSRKYLEWALLIIAILLTLGTSSDLIGDAATSYASAYSCVGLAAVLLGVGLVRMGRKLSA
ncbi:MAG: DUF2029 domain-containing protein [Planctomycetes bacterium]|nr:DUF2029 domain-containing protein [Planctomycetota bacterium]